MVQIKQSTLDFLSDLKHNNDSVWFRQNRKRYEDARSDFEVFVQALIDSVSTFDTILKGLEAKSCMFRINRDIRFSPDKSVYKTHFGAFIVRGGKSNGDRFAGYYFHIEPGGNNMIVGGAYLPPAPWLSAIRQKIDEQGGELLKIINNHDFVRNFGNLEGEKLKTAPRGYHVDHPLIELLKMKSLFATRMLSDKEILSSECFDIAMRSCKLVKPLNDFLNDYQ